ncbi:YidC/Oxa1 family membrane protein insertase [Pasteuria penetrans]|uniref:YidC/Oxa1 family membrane protein insertase n=1 Tax=Pasteuria penetrans TaxID=86005 RepID=UPI000FA85A31|nr:membrane protein insertase YidC [Pasteuria penetrans]
MQWVHVRRGFFPLVLYLSLSLSGCSSSSYPQELWTSEQVYHQSQTLDLWDHWLTVPMIQLLDGLRYLLGTYTMAILFIPVTVQLLVSPLIWRQNKIQIMIQGLRLEIQDLQKRYKDDPVQLHRAMRNFYEQRGVGSLSQVGCLPIMMQAPLFFGLFRAILHYIPLREERFLHFTLGELGPYWLFPLLSALAVLGVQVMGLVIRGTQMISQKSHLPWRMMLFSFTVSTLIVAAIMPVAANLYLIAANIAFFFQSLAFFILYARPMRLQQKRSDSGREDGQSESGHKGNGSPSKDVPRDVL